VDVLLLRPSLSAIGLRTLASLEQLAVFSLNRGTVPVAFVLRRAFARAHVFFDLGDAAIEVAVRGDWA
jgi:hypothetical protein